MRDQFLHALGPQLTSMPQIQDSTISCSCCSLSLTMKNMNRILWSPGYVAQTSVGGLKHAEIGRPCAFYMELCTNMTYIPLIFTKW